MIIVTSLIAFCLYLYCAYNFAQNKFTGSLKAILILAILNQAITILSIADSGIVFRIYNLLAAIVLSSLFTLVLSLIFDWQGRFKQAYLVLSVFAAISCILALLPLAERSDLNTSVAINIHHFLAALAYGFFILALAQMIETYLKSRAIREYKPESNHEGISLLEMEGIVFTKITYGFIVLSLTIATGIYVGLSITNEIVIAFNHKNLFAFLTWLTCVVLLFGRWQLGWRGKIAIQFIIACNVFLILSYLVTILVIDVILA